MREREGGKPHGFGKPKRKPHEEALTKPNHA